MTLSHNSIVADIPPVDTSKSAIALRARARIYGRQDLALRMRQEGAKPKAIAEATGAHSSDHAMRLLAAASHRLGIARHLRPHPDPDMFELRDPERLLIRSIMEVRLLNWDDSNCSNPDTGWVSRRCRHASGWAVSCARRRLAADPWDRNPLGVISLSGNGYIGFSDLGWSLAAALHSELTCQIDTWDASSAKVPA